MGIALGLGIPAGIALIAAGFLVSRRQIATQHAIMRLSDANTHDMLYGAGTTGSTTVSAMTGSGDPPGAFHEGLYHYMGDGTRYLSTNCLECMETRQNSFYTDDNLGTIPEDQIYEDAVFGQLFGAASSHGPAEDEADSPRGRGGTFGSYLSHLMSGPNVHSCNSALCNRCNGAQQTANVTFLDSPAMWYARDEATLSGDTDDMDSLLTFGNDDVTSNRAGQVEV
jgi:hypothetical protein